MCPFSSLHPSRNGKGSKNKKVYKIFKKYNKKIMPSAWLKNKGMYSKNRIKKTKEIKRNKKKRKYVAIKGNVLNVVRCVSKDVLEYARIFSVIVGLEKEP